LEKLRVKETWGEPGERNQKSRYMAALRNVITKVINSEKDIIWKE
jgi:hypothetical protein